MEDKKDFEMNIMELKVMNGFDRCLNVIKLQGLGIKWQHIIGLIKKVSEFFNKKIKQGKFTQQVRVILVFILFGKKVGMEVFK